MRNVIIAPFPPPYGGVGVAAANVREVLSRSVAGLEVFDTSSGRTRENLYARKGWPSYGRNLVLAGRLLKSTAGRSEPDTAYHLFVTSDLAFLRDALFLVILWIQRRHVVIHLHSKTQGEFFLAPSRLKLFARILGLARRVFVLSPQHLQFFSRFIPADKLGVLENFVLGRDFETGPCSKASDLLYVSRLSQMKGTWDLLHAVDIICNQHGRKDFHITMAGKADTQENEREFRRFITDRGLAATVSLAGLVTGPRKTVLFRDHGVFLFPSRFENSPISLKEATQAGMAVIASDIPANLNILERNGNHLTFAAGDSRALAEAIEKILDDSRLYAELRARAQSCRKFDETYAAGVLSPYLG